jgi:hypothetical protein
MERIADFLFFLIDEVVIGLVTFGLAIGLPLFSAWMGWPESIGLFLMGAVVFCGVSLFGYQLIEAVGE